MKQVLQNLSSGETLIEDVPIPDNKSGNILIQTRASLISAGTERMLLNFGRAGYLAKAKSQPEKVKQVWNKIKTDGVMTAIKAVRSKLDRPLQLGYCNVGVVKDVSSSGHQVSDLQKGDRVVSNGPHAEVVSVPKNLCARVPDIVSDEEAVFAVIGAIGLQGIRLAQPTMGENFVVIGLGLIGLMTVQILQANGCRVLGIDIDSYRCSQAKSFGAEISDLSVGDDPLEAAEVFSRRRGVDGVLITAATKSNEPVGHAAQMCRKNGRIVLVGVTGLELNRADFYEKEISFQVSCSYGPGRNDPEYEEKGHDYPVGYVRWTEQRNFEAVLNLMEAGKLNLKPLISHRFPLEKADEAYGLLAENKEPYLGIVLEYPGRKTFEKSIRIKAAAALDSAEPCVPVLGMIGAGNFAGQVLLPAIKSAKVRLKIIASDGGVTGTHLGKKFGFEISTTDTNSILRDSEINAVFIATRHNSHAEFVLKALVNGKNVFVEKPLCLTIEELEEITDAYNKRLASNKFQLVMVGFNRRFAPHVVKMKELLKTVNKPKSMIMTVNAGKTAADHWTQDPEVGGGRILGEVCHFIDLLRFLADSEIMDSEIVRLPDEAGDALSITLSFGDGSIGVIHYFDNGDKSFPKERLELFCGGKILQIDNFRVMRGYGWRNFDKMKLWRQDKGHGTEVRVFLEAIAAGASCPIPFEEVVDVMTTTIKLASRV